MHPSQSSESPSPPTPPPTQLLELDEGDAEVFGLAMHPSRDLLALGLVDGRALLYAYEGMGETCTLAAALRLVCFVVWACQGFQNMRPIRFDSSQSIIQSTDRSPHAEACRAVEFHPGGQAVFTASSDKCVRAPSSPPPQLHYNMI